MIISKKEESTSIKMSDRSILKFNDNEKIVEISNEVFSLVKTTIIANFDVSQILIDGGSSCDILYCSLFEKKCLIGLLIH